MGLKFLKGDIFKSKAMALVNPVNCKGVMGAGLALQFKKKFPDMFDCYKSLCDSGKMVVNNTILCFVEPNRQHSNDIIVLFPTKDDWQEPSLLEYIEKGLKDLKNKIEEFKITSVAIPALGCGLGGLDWLDVKKLIIGELATMKADIEVYEPIL